VDIKDSKNIEIVGSCIHVRVATVFEVINTISYNELRRV
jgi:hypothetical protein